jgi:(S)-mandelate dehydrogenase
VLKRILHPADAEKAPALGADGILAFNHGCRQIDLLPPAIDFLSAIVKVSLGVVGYIRWDGDNTMHDLLCKEVTPEGHAVAFRQIT